MLSPVLVLRKIKIFQLLVLCNLVLIGCRQPLTNNPNIQSTEVVNYAPSNQLVKDLWLELNRFSSNDTPETKYIKTKCLDAVGRTFTLLLEAQNRAEIVQILDSPHYLTINKTENPRTISSYDEMLNLVTGIAKVYIDDCFIARKYKNILDDNILLRKLKIDITRQMILSNLIVRAILNSLGIVPKVENVSIETFIWNKIKYMCSMKKQQYVNDNLQSNVENNTVYRELTDFRYDREETAFRNLSLSKLTAYLDNYLDMNVAYDKDEFTDYILTAELNEYGVYKDHDYSPEFIKKKYTAKHIYNNFSTEFKSTTPRISELEDMNINEDEQKNLPVKNIMDIEYKKQLNILETFCNPSKKLDKYNSPCEMESTDNNCLLDLNSLNENPDRTASVVSDRHPPVRVTILDNGNPETKKTTVKRGVFNRLRRRTPPKNNNRKGVKSACELSTSNTSSDEFSHDLKKRPFSCIDTPLNTKDEIVENSEKEDRKKSRPFRPKKFISSLLSRGQSRA